MASILSYLKKKYRCVVCMDTGQIEKRDLKWADISFYEACPHCSGRVIEQYELDIQGQDKEIKDKD